MAGGFSCWLFKLGFSTVSVAQDKLRLRAAANLEGEGKMSLDDFHKLLSSDVCAKPTITDEAIKMLATAAKAAELLAGGKQCIASVGFKHAAELQRKEHEKLQKS